MKTPRRWTILALLALIGLGVAIFQAHHFFLVRNGLVGFKSFCSFKSFFANFDCVAVESSPYAQLLPGFPLAAFVAGWCLSLLTTAVLGHLPTWRKEALKAALALTAVGAAFSAFYLVIMISILKTLCPLCLVVDVICFTSLAVVISMRPEALRQPSNSSHWKTFLVIGIVGVGFALVLSKILDMNRITPQRIEDMVTDIVNSPVLPVTVEDSFPSFGPKSAPVTIVKFSDFQCPACKRGAYTIHPLFKSYPTQVRFVFRNYPLDSSCNRKVEHAMHPFACEAARIAWCENQQGRFQEAYEALFENQELFAPGKISSFITQDPARAAAIDACAKSPESLAAVQKDIEEGIRLDVASTPTFFINGHRVEGYLPTTLWNQIIDRFLTEK